MLVLHRYVSSLIVFLGRQRGADPKLTNKSAMTAKDMASDMETRKALMLK